MPEFPSEVDLLIEGALIACCDDAGTLHEDGALAITNDKISWLGPRAKVPKDSTAPRVDAKGKILAPGLVNCHCHLADSLFRGLVEDLALEDWLQQIWKAEKAVLDAATTNLGARLGLAELALGGVTCVNDMFWFPQEAAKAATATGMRIVTGGLFFDPPGMDGKQALDRAADASDFCSAWADEPLVELAVTPHGTYTVCPENLRIAFELAQKHGALFHIHAAETAQENKIVAKQHGQAVIKLLAKHELLGPRTLLAHAVHVDADDIKLLADSNTMVSHNPVSNLKLASGFAPVPEMLAAGITVGLGTDGAVSGNDIDMWLALRLAAIMHRGSSQDCAAVKANQALHMATLGGARALGLGDRIGSLEVGKQADCILLDMRKPHAQPLFDARTHLVFGANSADVTDVWVAGKQVVAKRRLLNLDLDGLYAELDELAPRIKASLQ